MGNCSIGTCINGTMVRKAVHCDPVQYPVCKNTFTPLKVADESGCCFKYECQCELRWTDVLFNESVTVSQYIVALKMTCACCFRYLQWLSPPTLHYI